MSLRGQLLWVLSALFLAVLLATLGASLSETRRYLEQQLASHAQDTATALSLTLAQSLAKGDRVLAEAQVASIFDRGYFKRVDVLTADRTPVVSKELPEKIEGVPIWFSRLLPIVAGQGEAHVSAGWRQLGKVLVTSQPTIAYRHLWHMAVDMCLWVAGIYVAALLLMGLLLRFILKPLRLIERSAQAVRQKRFEQIAGIPKAPELARVVRAMNDMSRRVAEMLDEETARAEALRRQAYQDEHTGLANRRGFELRLKELLEGEYQFGLAAMIAVDLDGVRELIRSRGFGESLDLMRTVANAAGAALAREPVTLLARSNEFTFSLVVAGVTSERAAELAASLHERLVRVVADGPAADQVSIAMGVAFFHKGDRRSDIFARTDLAVESACQFDRNGLMILPDERDETSALGSFGWRMLIQDALKENRWRLVTQGAFRLAERGKLLHGELMARLIDGKGQLVPASRFMPMAIRHGLMPDIDRDLVTLALDYLRAQGPETHVAINLSPQGVASCGFLAWLNDRLADLGGNAGLLSFELSELGCLRDIEVARQAMELARRHGARFGIDHFGLDPQALRLLRQMPPDYVKLNGNLIGAMATDADAGALVRSIVQLAHSLEAQVIAQNVESEAQIAALLAASVDGGQGYLFGAPA